MAALTVMAIAFFGFNLDVGGLGPAADHRRAAAGRLVDRHGRDRAHAALRPERRDPGVGHQLPRDGAVGRVQPGRRHPRGRCSRCPASCPPPTPSPRCARCSTASRCRGARSAPAWSAPSSAPPSRSGTRPACCGRSAGGASSPASRRPGARARTEHGAAPLPHRAPSRAPGAGAAGGLPSAETSWPPTVSRGCCRSRCSAEPLLPSPLPNRCCRRAAVARVGTAASGTAVVATAVVVGRRRRAVRGRRRGVGVVVTRAAVAVVTAVVVGRRRRRAVVGDRRGGRAVVALVVVGGGRDDLAVVRTRRRVVRHLGDVLAVVVIALDRGRRGVVGRAAWCPSTDVDVVSSIADRRRGRRPSVAVVPATVVVGVDELVLVDASVELELVLDDGAAGISTRLSDDPLSTLAAAAVTPPTIRAAATPTAASLRECLVMGTGAIPSSRDDASAAAMAATASCSPASSSGRAGWRNVSSRASSSGWGAASRSSSCTVIAPGTSLRDRPVRYTLLGQQVLQPPQTAVGEHAHRALAATHHRRHRGHVEVDDHPQQHGVGLVGGQQADEGEGGAEVVGPLGRIVGGDRARAASTGAPTSRSPRRRPRRRSSSTSRRRAMVNSHRRKSVSSPSKVSRPRAASSHAAAATSSAPSPMRPRRYRTKRRVAWRATAAPSPPRRPPWRRRRAAARGRRRGPPSPPNLRAGAPVGWADRAAWGSAATAGSGRRRRPGR